ncbi:MAG: hypothetical protein HDS79_07790 [Bacteroidales bacterium]|nr:hypothetical protein [Bacteroidales bacterium]
MIVPYVKGQLNVLHVMVLGNTPARVATGMVNVAYAKEVANSYVKNVRERAVLLRHVRYVMETVFVQNVMAKEAIG